MKKKAIVLILFLALILCCFNVYFSIKFDGQYANLFTTISGWISGVATAVLGVLAMLQNVDYKNESKREHIIQELIKEKERTILSYNDFILCCDSAIIIRALFPLCINESKQSSCQKIENYMLELSKKIGILLNQILTYDYYFTEDNGVKKAFAAYYNLVDKVSEKFNHNQISDKVIEEIQQSFDEAIKELKTYIVNQSTFVNNCKTLSLKELEKLLSTMKESQQKKTRMIN